MEGAGTYTYHSTGDVFRGSFKAGRKSGAGVYHFKAGPRGFSN
jgi:hypothetical protein